MYDYQTFLTRTDIQVLLYTSAKQDQPQNYYSMEPDADPCKKAVLLRPVIKKQASSNIKCVSITDTRFCHRGQLSAVSRIFSIQSIDTLISRNSWAASRQISGRRSECTFHASLQKWQDMSPFLRTSHHCWDILTHVLRIINISWYAWTVSDDGQQPFLKIYRSYDWKLYILHQIMLLFLN